MAAKVVLAICLQAVFIQNIFGQCIPGAALLDDFAISRYGPAGYGAGYPGSVAPTSGGGFLITSSSPITPTGVTVLSENAIEGAITVIGELPFLGAVALEGALPTAGSGGINYGCGDGSVAIISEGLSAYPGGPSLPGYGPASAAYGPGPSYGYGIGYGGMY